MTPEAKKEMADATLKGLMPKPDFLSLPSFLPEPVCKEPSPSINLPNGSYSSVPSEDPLSPDYATTSISGGPPGLPGLTLALTIDRYSDIYFMVGVNFGESLLTGAGGSVTAGWIGGNPLDNQVPTPSEINSFLTDFSVNASVGAGAGAGITWNPESNVIATEVGTYTPQMGITMGWTWLISDNR